MKAQKIYDITMSLMDERKNNGDVDTKSTQDYNARAPGILTVLQNEIQLQLGEDALDEVKTLNTDIDLDDTICLAILPYGLAGRLLAQEDETLSSYFSNLYDSKINNYLNQYRTKARQVKRKDVYHSNLRVGG